MEKMTNVKGVELLSRAANALQDATGLSVVTTAYESNSPQDEGYDALLRIGFGDQKAEFSAVLKNHLNHGVLGAIASDIRRITPQGVLVTRHVTPNQSDRLKKLNIPFFDTAGNAFFNSPPLYVFVSGRRPAYEFTKEKPTRAFRTSGLKTLFALLCNPGLELKGYREIAAAADVSHGTIGWVMSDLEREGYLVEMGARGRRLVNKNNLLRRWLEEYPAQLRPKQMLSRLKSKELGWWINADLEKFKAYWGGEVAAAKLTEYLRPQIITVYAPKNLPEMQAKFALRQDPDGDVEILKKFWAFDFASNDLNIVPPLLVYADLMVSGDDRNIETAEIIYDTHVARLVGET